MDHAIAVALGLGSANHSVTEDTKRRVLDFATTRPLDMPYITAALVSRMLVNVGTGEAQEAIDALVECGSLAPIKGWGYVWSSREAWGRNLVEVRR